MTSKDIVREATIDIYNMVSTNNRSKIEAKLEIIYNEVSKLQEENEKLKDRLQHSEYERFYII